MTVSDVTSALDSIADALRSVGDEESADSIDLGVALIIAMHILITTQREEEGEGVALLDALEPQGNA